MGRAIRRFGLGMVLVGWFALPVWAQGAPPDTPATADAAAPDAGAPGAPAPVDPPPADAALVPEAGVGEAERLAAVADEHFEAGRYGDAVENYLKAYRLVPVSALLYNIGFIYDRKLNDPDLAMSFYRRYIRADDAAPELVGRATARLRELTAAREQAAAAEAAAAAAAAALRPAPATGAPVATPPVGATPDALTVVHRSPLRSPQAIGGWTALATGVALAATGGALWGLVRQKNADYEAARTVAEKRDLRATGRDMALAGDVLVAVGGAALTTGIVLLATLRGEPRGPATPTATPGGGLPDLGAVPLEGGALLTLGGRL